MAIKKDITNYIFEISQKSEGKFKTYCSLPFLSIIMTNAVRVLFLKLLQTNLQWDLTFLIANVI